MNNFSRREGGRGWRVGEEAGWYDTETDHESPFAFRSVLEWGRRVDVDRSLRETTNFPFRSWIRDLGLGRVEWGPKGAKSIGGEYQ